MKKITTILLTTALVAPLVLGGTVANATEEVATDNSNAKIIMRKRAGEGENDGPLRIEKISAINFGEQFISGSTATYNARYTAADENEAGKFEPTTIIVNDDRGTNKGWTLQASASEFTTGTAGVDEDAKVLKAAYLSLKNGKGNEAGEAGFENPGTAPQNNNIKLDNPGEAVTIAVAPADTVENPTGAVGVGRTSVFFGATADEATPIDDPKNIEGNSDVTLTIPGSSKKGEDAEYQATITWTLLDVPA